MVAAIMLNRVISTIRVCSSCIRYLDLAAIPFKGEEARILPGEILPLRLCPKRSISNLPVRIHLWVFTIYICTLLLHGYEPYISLANFPTYSCRKTESASLGPFGSCFYPLIPIVSVDNTDGWNLLFLLQFSYVVRMSPGPILVWLDGGVDSCRG